MEIESALRYKIPSEF